MIVSLILILAARISIADESDVTTGNRGTLDQKIDQVISLASYDFGQNNNLLSEISELIRLTQHSSTAREKLELKLLEVLRIRTTSYTAKEFICKQLSIIGTDESIPELSRMLSDPETSHIACIALLHIPGKAADRALIENLKTQVNKVGIINTLGMRQSIEAVAELGEIIGDSDPSVASAAISALGQIGGTEAAGILATAKDRMSDDIRMQILDSYLNCAKGFAANGDTNKALEIYDELIQAASPLNIRRAAFASKFRLSNSQGEAMLLDVLRSDRNELHSTAASLIRELPNSANSQSIASRLSTLSPMIQVQMISALADLGNENVRESIEKAAESDHQEVRIAALKALAALGNEQTVALLARSAAEKRGIERIAARKSLNRLKGEKVDQMILSLISTASANDKVELIGSVGARNIASAIPILFDMTGHADGKVRLESIEVLGEICTFEDVSKMIDVLLQAQSASERTATVKALAALILKGPDGGANSRLILERFKTTDDDKVRSSFIQVLGKVGEEESLPLIVEVYENKTGTLQTDAVRALADWPTAKPMDYLLNIVRTSENNTQKILALCGFIRQIGIADDLSDVEKTNKYKMAMALATNVSEKRMVMAGIGQLKTPEAMGMAERFLQDPILSAEAEAAFLKIAASIGRKDREKTLDVLQGILQRTKNAATHKEALSLIRSFSSI